MLLKLEGLLKADAEAGLQTEMREQGRLGTCQPLLRVTLPEGKTAEDCNKYTRALEQQVDVGVYPPEFKMPENVIFLNAYNLKEHEVEIVAKVVLGYVKG